MLQSFRENFAAVCQLNCTKPDFINEVKVMQHGSKCGKVYTESQGYAVQMSLQVKNL